MINMGFVRVAALSPNVTVADPAANAKSILELYRRADEQGCSLAVFPELALTGCTCGDLKRAKRNTPGSIKHT